MFSVVHKHRLQEYSKCCAYQTLFKITNGYETIKYKKYWSVTLLMFTENLALVKSENRIGDFGNFLNGFAKSPRVRRMVLTIEWRQFVLKNCEILHFVWGLYYKNSASYYSFTSGVMYKKYEMLVYTHPELLARFCWVNLSNAKIRPDLISKNSFSRPNLLWPRAIMALKCDRRWLLFFGCIYTAINSM